jgi:anti-sigma B factor antagonist
MEGGMELKVEDIEHGITKISLVGRLDIDGALKIDEPFNAIAKEKQRIVVDLSEVTFLASLGMRTLVTGAKAAWANGGKLILFNPQSNVEKVLRGSGIDTITPIVRDMDGIAAAFGV